MNDLDTQKHLLYITKLHAPDILSQKLRGVGAEWKNDTAYLTFYFSEEPTEDEKEDASVIATEIAAQMTHGFLEENFVVFEKSKALPEKFLAYIT